MDFHSSSSSTAMPAQEQIDLTGNSLDDNYESTGMEKMNEHEGNLNRTNANQTTNSTTTTHYHHRRKRSRISPTTRPNNPCNQGESSLVETDLVYKDHPENTGQNDEDRAVACNNEQLPESVSEASTDVSLATLKLTRLDPEFRDLISRYVRSEHIVRCLELAGFCTPYVLARLDETQLQRLEEFVGHACSLMKSTALREYFTGPIFSHDPLQFKLPSGAVCGILLAVNEIRKKYIRYQPVSGVCNTVDVDTMDTYEQSFSDVACQTDQTSFNTSTNQSVTTPELSVPINTIPSTGAVSPSQNMCNAISGDGLMRLGQGSKVSDSPNTPIKQESVVEATSAGTVAMMAAALQVAAAVATCSASNLPPSNVNLTTPLNTNDINSVNSLSIINNPFTSQLSADQNSAVQVSVNSNVNANRVTTHTSTSSTSGTTQSTTASQNSFMLNHSVTCGNGVFDDEAVDLERLKQHSSASAIRLASRQFVNAHLLRGRDFDMEMELSITPDGFKRVTGIFYCHLCREKRERTSAVRFSIARNRYPVLSNVLSHLKTHFHYRGQMLSGSQATQVLHPTNSLLKSANALTDSFMGATLVHPTGAFGSQINSNYRTDLASEQTTANSTSFLSPSVFSQVKPEPAAFPYPVDNEGAEDSSTSHTIFDNLSTSPPIPNLSSPNRKNSPPTSLNHSSRGLGLDVGISTRSTANADNSCNTLTS